MKQKEINNEIVILLKKSPLHQREIARKLATNQTNVRRAVLNLERSNILDHKNEGKNSVYFIKDSIESVINEREIENYKLVKILAKPNIRSIVKEIQEKTFKGEIDVNLIIVLFGSYAKDFESKSSDIDIYVNTDSKKDKKLIENISEKINIKFGSFDKGNPLFKEMVRDHIILNNVEGFLNLIR